MDTLDSVLYILDNLSNNHWTNVSNHVRVRQDFFAPAIICPTFLLSKSHFVQPYEVCPAPAVPTFWTPGVGDNKFFSMLDSLKVVSAQEVGPAFPKSLKQEYIYSICFCLLQDSNIILLISSFDLPPPGWGYVWATHHLSSVICHLSV